MQILEILNKINSGQILADLEKRRFEEWVFESHRNELFGTSQTRAGTAEVIEYQYRCISLSKVLLAIAV